MREEQRSRWRVVIRQPRSSEHDGQRGWRGKRNTEHLVLTAPELGGGVKVGEERVKLVSTEERVAARLRAAGNSYARDDGSLDIGG